MGCFEILKVLLLVSISVSVGAMPARRFRRAIVTTDDRERLRAPCQGSGSAPPGDNPPAAISNAEFQAYGRLVLNKVQKLQSTFQSSCTQPFHPPIPQPNVNDAMSNNAKYQEYLKAVTFSIAYVIAMRDEVDKTAEKRDLNLYDPIFFEARKVQCMLIRSMGESEVPSAIMTEIDGLNIESARNETHRSTRVCSRLNEIYRVMDAVYVHVQSLA